MKKSDKARIAISEKRQKLNSLLERGVTDENRAEVEKLTKELSDHEVEYRAAIVAEADEDRTAPNPDPQDAEAREFDRLLGRATVGAFIREAVNQAPVQGAEHEIRQAILGDHAEPGKVPFDVLLPRQDERREEHRADAVTPVADACNLNRDSRPVA